jgi:hypothetical protein
MHNSLPGLTTPANTETVPQNGTRRWVVFFSQKMLVSRKMLALTSKAARVAGYT